MKRLQNQPLARCQALCGGGAEAILVLASVRIAIRAGQALVPTVRIHVVEDGADESIGRREHLKGDLYR